MNESKLKTAAMDSVGGWGNEKPSACGGLSPFLWYWDGTWWKSSDDMTVATYQKRFWRGLAVKP
jgi:hypothetical protein